jgi:hypothetical protein
VNRGQKCQDHDGGVGGMDVFIYSENFKAFTSNCQPITLPQIT